MSKVEHIKVSDEAKFFLASNHQLLIDGEWVPSTSGEKIPVFDPGTEEKIAEVDSGNEDDISSAVSAAREALTGEWSKIPSHDRAQLLNKLADDIDACMPLLAELEVLDNGMPLALAHYKSLKQSLGKISKLDKKIIVESAEVAEEYKNEVSENEKN